jgi:hypothetical protein
MTACRENFPRELWLATAARMKASLRLAMLLMVALASCASPSIDEPNAKRISECFARIDPVGVGAGWAPLRTANLPPGALEVRIWSVGALGPTDGIAFTRNGSAWSGHRVTERLPKGAKPIIRTVAPKSGWEAFWATAEPLGILTLPDSSTLGKEELFYDGGTTVVEVRRDNKYRAYHYLLCAIAEVV